MSVAWSSYISLVLSVIGVALSIIAIRRTAKSKKLDLRLELRRLTAANEQELHALAILIPRAWESHINVASALGTSMSGGIEVWKNQRAADEEALRQLQTHLAGDVRYHALSEKELEDGVVQAHSVKNQIERITERYKASLAQDDKDREFVRPTAAARFRK